MVKADRTTNAPQLHPKRTSKNRPNTANAYTRRQAICVPTLSVNEYDIHDFLRLIKSGADFLDAAVGDNAESNLEQAVRNYASLVDEKMDEICAIFGQPGSSLFEVAEHMAHAATLYRDTIATKISAN